MKKNIIRVLIVILVIIAVGVGLSFTTPDQAAFEARIPQSFQEIESTRDVIPVYMNHGFISSYSQTKTLSSVTAEKVSFLGFAGQVIQADDNVILTFLVNCTVWMPSLLQGAGLTVGLTVVSTLIGIVLSIFLALGKISRIPVVKQFCQAYIFFFRGTPLLMQLFFVWYGLPLINPMLTITDKFFAAALAFSLNSGAYCAEYVRAAIQSIDKGQFEAAKTLGLNSFQTMTLIIIPQTYKRVMPSFANEFIMVLKDASLTSIIAMQDLSKTTQAILTSTNQVSVYIPAVILYLIMTGVCTKIFNTLERRFSIYE